MDENKTTAEFYSEIKRISAERVEKFKEILDLSLKINDEMETQSRSDSVDNIISLIADREKIIKSLKESDVEIKHYISKLPPGQKEQAEEINAHYVKNPYAKNPAAGRAKFTGGAAEFFELKAAQFEILGALKEIENKNRTNVTEILNSLKNEITHLKKNRNITEKYLPDDIKTGTIRTNKA